MSFFQIVLLIGVLFSIVPVLLWRRERKRRRALKEVAESLGLRYSYLDPYGLQVSFEKLNHFARGRNQYGFNVVHGEYKDVQSVAFDYHFTDQTAEEAEAEQKKWRKKQPDSYIVSLMIALLDRRFPHLVARPTTMWEKFADLPREFEDCEVASAELRKTHQVKSPDPRFASRLFHEDLVQFFVRNPSASIEICGNVLVVHLAEILDAESVESQLDRLAELVGLIPSNID